MSIFSIRLKEYREKLKRSDKKWTQQYVADKVGVARVTYTAYEGGTKLPPIDTTNKIAELFDVTTDYLMGRSDDPRLSEREEKEVDLKTDELLDIINSMPDGDIRDELINEALAFVKGYSKGLTNTNKDK